MQTMTRRTLHHNLAPTLDHVRDSGQPVRIQDRDGRAVLLVREDAPLSVYEQWDRSGQIQRRSVARRSFASLRKIDRQQGEEILVEMTEDN